MIAGFARNFILAKSLQRGSRPVLCKKDIAERTKAVFPGVQKRCHVPWYWVKLEQWTESFLSSCELQRFGVMEVITDQFFTCSLKLKGFWNARRVTDRNLSSVLFKYICRTWWKWWSLYHLWCNQGMLCYCTSSGSLDGNLFKMHIQFLDSYHLSTRDMKP